MIAALLDLVLPRLCVGCQAVDRQALCARCRSTGSPVRSAALGFPLAATCGYDGAVRTALLAYKERDRRDLAAALGTLLADAVRALEPGRDAVLVPVPSSLAARRARGGDHVLRLARVAARSNGLRVRTPLRLVRAVRDSAGLDSAARQANLTGAMAGRPPTAAAPAVLVDDIATTGATLVEAARALGAAGWRVSGAAVVAVTERRDGPDRWRVPSHGSSVGMT